MKNHKVQGQNIADCLTWNLKYLRRRYRVTQQDIGDVLGVTFQQVQKYETGVNRISAEALYRLKEYYGVPYEAFFDVKEDGGLRLDRPEKVKDDILKIVENADLKALRKMRDILLLLSC